MDPSEIIKVPLQLRRLYSFAFFPVVVIMLKWVKDSPQRLTTKIMSLLKLTLTVYGLFGLCGTNIVDNYKHSLTAALYVASLVSTTWKTTAAEEASAAASLHTVIDELPIKYIDSSTSDLLSYCRFYGIILTLIPFQTFNVLDSGAQIQRWPLPILLGSTYGYCIGSIIGILSRYISRKKNKKDDK